jgi:hypothetical protein
MNLPLTEIMTNVITSFYEYAGFCNYATLSSGRMSSGHLHGVLGSGIASWRDEVWPEAVLCRSILLVSWFELGF